MAELVNTAQRIATGVTYPKPAYSRVVSVCAQLLVPAASKVAVTEVIGGGFWLLSVRVWLTWLEYTELPLVFFDVICGTSGGFAPVDISGWQNILPSRRIDQIAPWCGTPEARSFVWSLCRRFPGENIRLGLSALLVGAGKVYCYASFEVSEG